MSFVQGSTVAYAVLVQTIKRFIATRQQQQLQLHADADTTPVLVTAASAPVVTDDADLPAPAQAIIQRASEISAKLPLGQATHAGSARVAMLEAVAALASLHAPSGDRTLVDSGCAERATVLFFALPFNNIIHGVVCPMIKGVLGATPAGALSAALVAPPIELHRQIVAAYRANEAATRVHAGKRLGYMGYVVEMVTALEQAATAVPDGAVALALKVLLLQIFLFCFRCLTPLSLLSYHRASHRGRPLPQPQPARAPATRCPWAECDRRHRAHTHGPGTMTWTTTTI